MGAINTPWDSCEESRGHSRLSGSFCQAGVLAEFHEGIRMMIVLGWSQILSFMTGWAPTFYQSSKGGVPTFRQILILKNSPNKAIKT